MSNLTVLVGCGHMGSALARGWLQRGLLPLAIIEPDLNRCAQFQDDPRIMAVADPQSLPEDIAPRTLVLAIKPQAMPQALAAYRRFTDRGALAISIAAGKTLAFFEQYFPGAAIVRAMPNLPAAIARGIAVAVANERTSAERKAEASELLAACGEIAWVTDEGLIDAVTAVSGGGPAYLFLLIETLARAGQEAGLPPELAMRLARSTIAGAGELVHRSDLSPAALREAVSSPGGTTLAALTLLMAKDGLQPLMTRAIAAAAERSRQLAQLEEP